MLDRILAVDSHAHISLRHFDNDREEVINRARKNGVIGIINPAINPSDFDKALKISQRYHGYIYVALGLAPQTASNEDLIEILDQAKKHRSKYIAIGECGLDYYWVRSPAEIENMVRIFQGMVQLAVETKLPMIIHARTAYGKNAYREIAKILNNYGIEKAVFHAFFGRKKDVEVITKNNWYIGIPTVYLRRRDLWSILKSIPLHNMLIETDSPYLSPEKGKRNEPSNVLLIIELLSKIFGKDPYELSIIILENTKKFFGIKIEKYSQI